MEKKIVVVGLNEVGIEYAQKLSKLNMLSGVFDPSASVLGEFKEGLEKTKKLYKHTNFAVFEKTADLWNFPFEGMVLCTAPGWYGDFAPRALRKNAIVLAEPPLYAGEVPALLKNTETPANFQSAFRALYHPNWNFVLEDLPKKMSITLTHPHPTKGWKLKYGMMWDAGIHAIALVENIRASCHLGTPQLYELFYNETEFKCTFQYSKLVIKLQALWSKEVNTPTLEVTGNGWSTSVDLIALMFHRVFQGAGTGLAHLQFTEEVHLVAKSLKEVYDIGAPPPAPAPVSVEVETEKTQEAPVEEAVVDLTVSAATYFKCTIVEKKNDVETQHDILFEGTESKIVKEELKKRLEELVIKNPLSKFKVKVLERVTTTQVPLQKQLLEFF